MSETNTQIDTEEEINVDENINEDSSDAPPQDDQDAENSLGDAGKKALDAMKAKRNAAIREAKDLKAELDRIKAEAESASKPAEEQALDAARREATIEATRKANERILRSELRAAAKGKLADPTDAQLYIDLANFEVGDDGDIDSDALEDAIDELLARKPHLAAAPKSRFDGNADQGVKGKEATPSQLSESDLQSMTPEEVNAARRAGRLNKLLGIN